MQKNSFRIKSSFDKDDQSQLAIDILVTPSTPTVQSGTFGALEPPVSPIKSDFTIPLLNPQWNQVVELQLSDGNKVFIYKKI
jgi:hypothetical protein